MKTLTPDCPLGALAVSSGDALIVACKDGFVRAFPTTLTGVASETPGCEFETVYARVSWLGYCPVHDTVLTIERRRGDDTGVVRVYYNWRTAHAGESGRFAAFPAVDPTPRICLCSHQWMGARWQAPVCSPFSTLCSLSPRPRVSPRSAPRASP